mmetsp:Transcript_175389/g.562654  ORF Transcript_175389/g.562654 Transcript_175389/m.562654 type:complete len:273 (-) Transcript_175389:486-1304(-)
MASLNERFGASMNSTGKSPLNSMRISVMARSLGLSGFFKNNICLMSVPAMLAMAHPSPTPCLAAWPPASMPSTRAPRPSFRCVRRPKPGDTSWGEAKVNGPTVGRDWPPGANMSSAQTSSGAMISAVPTQVCAKEPATSLATPKSTSFTRDSELNSLEHTKMFSHFKSRCKTCLPCKNCTAPATCLNTPRAMASSKRPCRPMKLANSPPSTSSVTIILYLTIVLPCVGNWCITTGPTSQLPMQVTTASWPCARSKAFTSRSKASARPSVSSS